MTCDTVKKCFLYDVSVTHQCDSMLRSIGLCLKDGGVLAVVMMRLASYSWEKRFIWRLAPYIKRLNEILTGFECHLEAELGRGLFLPHTQNIVIGAGAIVGENVTIYNGVTLGGARREEGVDPKKARYPKVGNGVVIYTGAKLIGPIVVGSSAVIGANSVVLRDVPENMVAVGIPAKCRHPYNRLPT